MLAEVAASRRRDGAPLLFCGRLSRPRSCFTCPLLVLSLLPETRQAPYLVLSVAELGANIVALSLDMDVGKGQPCLDSAEASLTATTA